MTQRTARAQTRTTRTPATGSLAGPARTTRALALLCTVCACLWAAGVRADAASGPGASAAGDSPDNARGALRRAHGHGVHVSGELIRSLGKARRAGNARKVACIDGLLSRANSLRARLHVQADSARHARRRDDRDSEARTLATVGLLVAQLREIEHAALACDPQAAPTGTRVTTTIPDAPRHEPAPLAAL